MTKCKKKTTTTKAAGKKLGKQELKGVTGGLEISPVPLKSNLAAPFVPGGSVVTAAISGVGSLKSSQGS